MKAVRAFLCTAIGLLCLAACASQPLETRAPARFDLDGSWLLLADLSDTPPVEPRERYPTRPDPRRRQQRPAMGLAFVTHDFPGLRARRLDIEQVGDSMGIAYDGKAYRDVSWGERERGLWKINAGWNDAGELVIRYRASDARATETLSLDESRERLRLRIEIRTEDDSVDVTRIYERT